MNKINISAEQVISDYRTIYDELIADLRSSNSMSSSIDENKIKWFYSWGSFVKKAKTESDKNLNEIKRVSSIEMLFNDRIEEEMSKIRVTIHMDAGKHGRSERIRKFMEIPIPIQVIVVETTKLRMFIEQSVEPNEEIIASIPEVDSTIVPPNHLDMIFGKGHNIPHTTIEPSTEIADEVEEVNRVNVRVNPKSTTVELDMDVILEKISTEGADSLSAEERNFLENI
jgi:hypothetical protein